MQVKHCLPLFPINHFHGEVIYSRLLITLLAVETQLPESDLKHNLGIGQGAKMKFLWDHFNKINFRMHIMHIDYCKKGLKILLMF